MTRQAWFIAAAAFFLVAGVIGGLFSYTGLETANKWSSVISMFLALASFTLSALFFRQSTVRKSLTAPTSSSKYDSKIYGARDVSIGDNQEHNTTVTHKTPRRAADN